MDRRQKKSEEAIMNAFFELMKTKDLEKISIREIAEKADVNRGTIYLRYEDKYDLYRQFLEKKILEMVNHCDQNKYQTKENFIKIFEFFEAKKEIFQTVLSGMGGAIFFKLMKEEIIKKITSKEGTKGTQEVFISSAIVGTLEWWILEDDSSAKEIADSLWPLLVQLPISKDFFNPSSPS